MHHRYLLTCLHIILSFASSLDAMDTPKELTFEQHVNILQQDCNTKTLTENGCIALLKITPTYSDSLLIKNKTTAAYATFQQLDLSAVLSQAPTKYPQLLEKPYEKIDKISNTLKKLTYFRLLQGTLAQHNSSVTYNVGEEFLFNNISNNRLDIIKEATRYKADYVLCVTGFCNPEGFAKEQNLIADLLEQEICLRNNHNAKTGAPLIYEAEVIYKSKNQKR